jgi:hypothetical protein
MGIPLMLTVAIEQNALRFFDALKKIYYPQEPGAMGAHIRLIGQLPLSDFVENDIAAAASRFSSFTISVKSPVASGNRVFYPLEAPQLRQLFDLLLERWNQWLLPQDKKFLIPEIVIQGHASEEEATELLQFLQQQFSSFNVTATGLQLWAFEEGRWRLQREFAFAPNNPEP